MGDNIKDLYLDKEMQEIAEELRFFKQAIKERKQYLELVSDTDTPEERDFLLLEVMKRVMYLISKVDIQTFRKEWKEVGKTQAGMRNRDFFRCVCCMNKYDWRHLVKDEVVTISDLKELKHSSFYQCHVCKRKFGPNGITS